MEPSDPPSLETTITEVGTLLVQLHKYRAGIALHPGLLAVALGIGDRARRRHHRQVLEQMGDADLLGEALDLRRRLEECLAIIRSGPDYRAAVVAHAAGDHTALARLLPLVFDDLDPVPAPPILWHPFPWLRRNRPRPAADLAAIVVHLTIEGIDGDADALAPGLDPELPAVPLETAPSGGDPLLLRYDAGVLPPAVFRLRTVSAFVVHVPRLHVPAGVVLLDALDDEELGEVTVDYPRYRAELSAALAAVGLSVTGG
ncbi:MAG TPA: hypothetical protein VGR62_14390 [Candidatus Binatia bacterium]|jgi:hypothetical protein|nr:hypothetical protein [Candidatus Binatia bacterium]